jgi:hypothetical protein
MNKQAPKLRLIQGGKKDHKVKLKMGLFFIFSIVVFYMLVIALGT